MIVKEKPTILVVDDQPTNIQVLSEVLKEDYKILFATSGEKALKVATTKHIDLVLLDIVMPGMDGYEVCDRLKQEGATEEVPVIFLTAMNDVEDETKGFHVGAVDFIAKPIRPAVVKARVRTHVELKQQKDILRNIATLDGLTGIPNRRRFDEYLLQEWKRAKRAQSPITLMLADVDHFKKYNDNYGHGAGDECLKKVAQTLEDTFERSTDMVARYGGEEFCCVLPDTKASDAISLLKTLLANLVAMKVFHDYSSVSSKLVSASIGAITVVPTEQMSETASLEIADQLLYEAKQNGRAHARHRDLDSDTMTVVAL